MENHFPKTKMNEKEIGFDSRSFHLDEDEEHSFELRDE